MLIFFNNKILFFFQGYFVSLFNRFDFFVVVSSIVELILTNENVMEPLGKRLDRMVDRQLDR